MFLCEKQMGGYVVKHVNQIHAQQNLDKFSFVFDLSVSLTFVLDTSARQSPNKFGFALDLSVSLTFVLDTSARQSPNKFGFALDLSVSLQVTKQRCVL